MKKLVLFALSLSFIITCFAGCTNTAPSPGNVTPPDNTGTPDENGNSTVNGTGRLDGDLREILANLYEIYNSREDVKNAQAIIDDITPRFNELSETVWSEDHGLSVDELAELQAEYEELQQLFNKNTALLPAHTEDEILTPQGTEHNDNIKYFIGADDIPFTEGFVSEGMLAYSLVLLRMEPGADIEAAKTRIRNGVDPMKWVCAGVDPKDVIVDSSGDIVILIMAKNSKELHESFLELVG
jgi:hypothetical protein